MSVSRRGFLGLSMGISAGLIAGAGLVALPRRAGARMLQPATWFVWTKISPRCWVAQGEGGNVLAIGGDGEVIVIDAKNPAYGAMLRREAEATCGAPVKTLINTHHHGDHTGGNWAFTKDCTVIAHEKAKARIASQMPRIQSGGKNAATGLATSTKPGKDAIIQDVGVMEATGYKPESWQPTKTVGDVEKLRIAGVNIELLHVGPGHTDNDVIVFLPDENVMHSGDLLFNNMWPFPDRAGGCESAGWIVNCEKILEICGERKIIVVPGHGEVGDKEIAQRQRQMFIALRAKAAAALKAGEKKEAFLARPWDEYKDYAAADSIKARTLGAVYDEAAGTPAT